MSTNVPIASVTLSAATPSVTFSGIPQTYTDLVLVRASGGTSIASTIYFRFNGDTASNYSHTSITGYSNIADSGRSSNQTKGHIGGSWGTSNTTFLQIQNYSNTTTNKTVLYRFGDTTDTIGAGVAVWRQTSAITSIELSLDSTITFTAGSTFNLYGIANASITNVAKATGGDSVYTDGTYWYHTFRSSGTFTPTEALTADYLVVAGGGGGAGSDTSSEANGGGGAGGFRTSTDNFLTDTSYTITVGAGGVGGNYVNPGGSTNGTSTSISGSGFTTFTASGGGYGSWLFGNSGGSGGGGGRGRDGGSGNSGGYSPVEGYAGGNAPLSSGGGGGGGASSAGANGASTVGGAGGAGASSSISGSSVTYAGGGGGAGTVTGGSGGSGGGGAGASGSVGNGTSGTSNTGGGGGGGRQHNGGNGGSGIVIVRYPV